MRMGTALIILMTTVATAEGEWQRNGRSLLTNFNNMYNPCVVEVRTDYRYKMWFFGWAAGYANPGVPGCDAIFHARSRDLRTWEVYSKGDTWDRTMNPANWVPVLHASDRWYEAWHVGDPSVVLKDGKFYMAYSATSKPFAPVDGYPATMVQCLMGAVSADGIHWKKTNHPLLIRPEDTASPEPEPGRIGDFHRPSLHWEGGKWRLWFDYFLPGKGVCMGYAENTDDFMRDGGFKIQHDLRKPLLENWPNPDVIRIGDTYHGFSDPSGYPVRPGESGWKSRQLREAVSSDGLSWKKLDFIPPDEDADACHVPQAFRARVDGNEWLYLFYATQIGYKKSDGQYHYQYDRIRAMRRPVGLAEPGDPAEVDRPRRLACLSSVRSGSTERIRRIVVLGYRQAKTESGFPFTLWDVADSAWRMVASRRSNTGRMSVWRRTHNHGSPLMRCWPKRQRTSKKSSTTPHRRGPEGGDSAG